MTLRSTKRFVVNACTIPLCLSLSWTNSHAGGGVYDFLDPCIAAKDDYWSHRSDVLSAIAQEQDAVKLEQPTEGFRQYWFAEKIRVMREYFEDEHGAAVRASGANIDEAFNGWHAKEVQSAGGDAALVPLMTKDFRRTKLLALEKKSGASTTALDAKKKELYEGCPSDVGNQIFRGTVTVVTAPVNIVVGNFEAAKNEKNVVTKALRGATGISAEAIKDNGFLGGENSEANKLKRRLGL